MGPGFGETVPRKSQRQENVPSHIFTPRSYQVEILDTALEQNTIVCLGSSAGKAFIATMLIKGLAHQVRPPFRDGGRQTIFLANTREDTEYQAGVIARETHLNVGRFLTCKGVNNWERDKWDRILHKHQVLVMMPNVLLRMFERELLTFNDINLIVFDECEMAVQETHPYSAIMKAYLDSKITTRPRILGLTATVLSDGVSTPEELEKKIRRLETTLNSTAGTSTDMIVADLYGAKPKEVLVRCEGYEDKTGMVKKIEEIIGASLRFLENCNMSWDPKENSEDPKVIPRIVYTECLNILHLLGPWCAGRVAQTFCKQLYKMEQVEEGKTHKLLMEMTHTTLQMIHQMVDYDFENVVQCLEDFLEYMSPKVLKLLDTLSSYKPDDNFMIIGGNESPDMDYGGDLSDDSLSTDDEEEQEHSTPPVPHHHRGKGGHSHSSKESKPQVHYVAMKRTVTAENGTALEKPQDDSLCGIIFVERRHTAFALNKLIQEMCNWNPDLYFIQCCHITGKSNHRARPGVREAEVVHRKQEETLRQFRNKEVNLLVSTNLLEEGVDVPRCNLVFRFDAPNDYRSYVQSKGRARAPRSTFYMLVDEPSVDNFTKNLNIFKGIENVLLGRCQCKDDIGDEMVDITEADLQLSPYLPNPDIPAIKVTMSSAILLVNRYCAKLPSDAFTHLTPKCTVEKNNEGLYVATLQLPINSPIKEPITGNPMSVRRFAKMAVALKTCQILHQKGELDDNLLPVGKEVIRYEDEEGEWEETQGQARPGTTKRKQYYHKKPADALLGHPLMNKPCYLYTIRMVLTCPITEEQNTRGRKIHDPDETHRGFGILSEKPIPLVPHFPVFTRSGEVTTSMDLVSDQMLITEDDYRRFKAFHHTVFTHVLRLEKDPMKFDLDKAITGYIIVPLLRDEGSLSIDWNFISTVEEAKLNCNRRPSAENKEEKENFVFKNHVFEDAVVMPSYRNIDQPQYFYVAEIRHDLNPKSPFPSPELYDTFEHYYASKYSLEITNVDQPLLDVDHTSARLNLLTPRYMNQKGVALPTSSAETRRARRENLQQKQILVPELCDVHPFPASLWRKAVCLPAILYRMNCLLIADEIRMTIASGAHIGQVSLPTDYRFSQLEFGFSTKPSDAIQEKPPPAAQIESPSTENRFENSKTADKGTKQEAFCDDNDNTENDIKDEITESDLKDDLSENDVKDELTENDTKDDITESDMRDDGQELSEAADICSSMGEDFPSECASMNVIHKSLSIDQDVEELPNTNNQREFQCDCEEGDSKIKVNHSENGHEDKSKPEQIPLDSPLYIDTTAPYRCSKQQMEDSTFHTPRLSPCDLLYNRPSSQNSASSFHTADTSLSPEPSPKHCSPSTAKHNNSTCLNGDLDYSPRHHQQSANTSLQSTKQTVECFPDLPQDTAAANMGLTQIGNKESNDCDTINCNPTATEPPQKPLFDCLCTKNGTVRMDNCLKHTNNHKQLQCTTFGHDETQSTNLNNDKDFPSILLKSQKQLNSNSEEPASNGYAHCNGVQEETADSQAPWSGLDDFDEDPKGQTTKESTGDNATNVKDKPLGISTNELREEMDNNANSREQSEEEEDEHENEQDEEDKHQSDQEDKHESDQEDKHQSDQDERDEHEVDKGEEDDDFDYCMEDEQEIQIEEDIQPLVTFDKEVDLKTFVGPSPCTILQTMTMSNANDFFNLERLETIGDSFLKFAITVYLYCTYPGIHEGKLSYLRSKQVSNYNLYKLGKKKGFPDCMVAAKFEPTENWLPPGFIIKTSDAYKGINVVIASTKNKYGNSSGGETSGENGTGSGLTPEEKFRAELEEATRPEENEKQEDSGPKTLIPYNLQTQHSLPDKSIADCVEALIGCYLTTCGQRAALQFMSWLGLKVLPELERAESTSPSESDANQNLPTDDAKTADTKQTAPTSKPIGFSAINDTSNRTNFGELQAPSSPLLTHVPDAKGILDHQLDGYEAFENRIQYTFRDRAYLLQAFTHASYHYNTITDCYQRLEFLGDAILDYVITRHLFEDVKKHSPGILTDLRSALVNNNIFAALAVKWDFHKFFKAISPQLFHVIEKFVARQKEKHDEISLDEEFDMGEEDNGEEVEDIEIPKALGDIFESVAGAIYLDSGMSLDTVWRVYYRMMKPQIDMFTAKIPKSPVRELLELEPETAKFEKPERTLDGKIRVMVNVVGKGEFRGIGRNYRIAKSAAAKRALKMIRLMEEQMVQQAMQALKFGLNLPQFTKHTLL